eukprot:354132-Chlamydomonas_euryale.AAC.4
MAARAHATGEVLLAHGCASDREHTSHHAGPHLVSGSGRQLCLVVLAQSQRPFKDIGDYLTAVRPKPLKRRGRGHRPKWAFFRVGAIAHGASSAFHGTASAHTCRTGDDTSPLLAPLLLPPHVHALPQTDLCRLPQPLSALMMIMRALFHPAEQCFRPSLFRPL